MCYNIFVVQVIMSIITQTGGKNMTTSDFLYEHGERIEKLLLILEEEQLKKRCFNQTDMQIHMFLISARLLEEEQVCIFGDLLFRRQTKMREKVAAGISKDIKPAKKTSAKYTELFKLLKKEVEQLEDPSMRNAIFIEKVEENEKNMYYFMNYVEKQVNNPRFLSEFWCFCDSYEVMHEAKKEERMAI